MERVRQDRVRQDWDWQDWVRPDWVWQDWVWLAAILGYFLVQMVSRLMIGPGLDLDEAEAFYVARDLAWGYGPQPPLYFWLQRAVFAVAGEGILALALLKAAILGGAGVLVFRVLRQALPPMGAGVAALSVGLLPELVWESQRALTHTNLVFLMSVATVWAFLRVLGRGQRGDYLIFGLVVGLGLLSKHNYGLLVVGVVGAGLIHPAWRARLSARGLGMAALVAGVVVLPFAVWLAGHLAQGTASVSKLGLAQGAGGIGVFGAAVLSLYGLAALVLGPLLWLRRRGPWHWPAPVRLLALTAGVCLALVAVLVVVTGTAAVQARWLMPLGWGLVPAAIGAVWAGLGAGARRALFWGCTAIWGAVVLALPYASLRDPGYRAARFDLVAAALPPGRPLVTGEMWVLGNLALRAPRVQLYRAGSALPQGPVTVLAEAGAAARVAAGLGLQIEGRAVPLDVPTGRHLRRFEVLAAHLPGP